MSTSATVRPTATTLIKRAEELVPVLRARARECETLRRIPDETIADLRAAELFQLCSPQRCGGWGYGMEELGQVTRILAQGCASTAWVYSFYIIHNQHFVLYLEPELRDEVLAGQPYALAASSAGIGAAGSGVAIPVEGGYRLTGKWPFASGTMNADYVHVMTLEQTDGEEPKVINLFLSIEDVTVHDIWYFGGMAGTASNTVSAEDLFVPASRRFDIAGLSDLTQKAERGADAAPLEGFSALRIFDVVLPAVAVGSAEAALEVFREIVLSRVVAFGLGPQREHPEAWSRYAAAASTVRTARLLWDSSLETTTRLSNENEKASVEEAAHLRMASSWICRLARDAIAIMCDGAGSSVNHLDHPLQRFRRDVDVLKSHSYLHWDGASTTAGRALLGLEPIDPLLLI